MSKPFTEGLCIIGEDICAGSPCVISMIDGKLYAAGETAGTYVADAVEQMREGFRAWVKNGEAREDDA